MKVGKLSYVEIRTAVMQETQDMYNDDAEELQSKKVAAFWRRTRFRQIYVPITACACLLALAIYFRVQHKHLVSFCTASNLIHTFCRALFQLRSHLASPGLEGALC